MIRTIKFCIAIALLLTGLSAMTAFALSNGQNAGLVLGQALFTTSAPGTTATTMSNPGTVAVDPTTEKVFVSDLLNHRVLRFDTMAALFNGDAAEGVLGQANFTSGTANRGGAAAANTLAQPEGLAFDAAGNLWVADLLNNRILRFDNASAKGNGANADGVLGQANFSSNTANRGGAVAANTLNTPTHPFVDSAGRLWVADGNNNRVLRYDNAAAKADGADADGVLGQALFTTSGSASTQSTLNVPRSVFGDTAGRLFIADTSNYRILRFDNAAAKANGANADGVLGQINFTNNLANRGGAVAANTLNLPRAISMDTAGSLLVADESNNRVLIFLNAASLVNGANASIVIGQADFVSNLGNRGGTVAANTLSAPGGLRYFGGYLWVSDQVNNRVLAYLNTGAGTTGLGGGCFINTAK